MWNSGQFWGGILAGIVAVVVIGAAVALVVIYSGAYNVAATEGHYSLVRWAFSTTFHNSVERNADAVEAPASFSGDMVAAGAGEYKATCQHCHAGPGVERAAWAEGMLPKPPHLTEAVPEWEPGEIFWIVRHGIRMSGMPALGPTHDDETLWNIVAFVSELPKMTPERYASLGGDDRRPDTNGHGAGGGGSNGASNGTPAGQDQPR